MKNYLITLIVLTGIFNSCTSRGTSQPINTDSLSSTTTPFVDSLETLINPNIKYDARYRKLTNMCDDVPANVGVCSDVIIRAKRCMTIVNEKAMLLIDTLTIDVYET